MPNIHRVANHLRYARSSWAVALISFILTVMTVVVAGSLFRAGENALAGEYVNTCHYHCPTPSPTPTPTPTVTPTVSPTPSPSPTLPSYICTWMKAVISGKTVTLTAKSNVIGPATVVGYRYDFADGYTAEAVGVASHTYAQYGTYTTKAWIKYVWHGQAYWTAQCTLIVNVGQVHPTPSPSPSPTPTPTPTPSPTPTYSPSPSPTYSPSPSPSPSYSPQPSGVGSVNNNNVNNNNSSATANVYVNQNDTDDSARVSTAGYTQNTTAPTYTTDTGKGGYPAELPKTGADDVMIGGVGLGTVVAASTMYARSRRELIDAILGR